MPAFGYGRSLVRTFEQSGRRLVDPLQQDSPDPPFVATAGASSPLVQPFGPRVRPANAGGPAPEEGPKRRKASNSGAGDGSGGFDGFPAVDLPAAPSGGQSPLAILLLTDGGDHLLSKDASFTNPLIGADVVVAMSVWGISRAGATPPALTIGGALVWTLQRSETVAPLTTDDAGFGGRLSLYTAPLPATTPAGSVSVTIAYSVSSGTFVSILALPPTLSSVAQVAHANTGGVVGADLSLSFGSPGSGWVVAASTLFAATTPPELALLDPAGMMSLSASFIATAGWTNAFSSYNACAIAAEIH